MEEAGVPVLDGYHGAAQDDRSFAAAAARIGYPVLVKPVAGGGGRGLRAVEEAGGLGAALAAARREGASSFGDDRLLLERRLAAPRHVEVQVFADGRGDAVHLFERDCSVQRRNQKVVEEAPAPGLPEAVADGPSPKRPCAPPARSAMSAPARWNSCSTRRGRSSSSR